MSCVSDFAWPHCESIAPPFRYTIIKQMFYEEKHLTVSCLSSNPYVVCEGFKRTTYKQPNWPMGTMCVSLSAFPGARSVCAGSKEAEALIKEQAWYRDASLTAWGHTTWWGPDESHQTGLLPPNQQPVGAGITFHCLLPRASFWVLHWFEG